MGAEAESEREAGLRSRGPQATVQTWGFILGVMESHSAREEGCDVVYDCTRPFCVVGGE